MEFDLEVEETWTSTVGRTVPIVLIDSEDNLYAFGCYMGLVFHMTNPN
jgi:hypothetical protein